jgi:hypothetical protein
MAKTMKWPPVPKSGRIPMIEGVDTTEVLIIQTLGDLQTNPFNSDRLSLGDVTFKNDQVAKGRIDSALQRLRNIISVDSVTENSSEEDAQDGSREYIVQFTDRETRQPSQVTING